MNKYFQFEMFVMPSRDRPPERINLVGSIISETEETVTVAYLTPFKYEREIKVFMKKNGIEFNHFRPEHKL